MIGYYRFYLQRSHGFAFLAVALVIAAVVMVNFFDRILEDIASGIVAREFILSLLGAGFLRYFAFAFGSAACLGGIYVISQMVSRNELVAWQASGTGPQTLFRYMLSSAVIFSLFAALFYLWLTPVTERYYSTKYEEARESTHTELIKADEFSHIPGIGHMYVGAYDQSRAAFEDSFFVLEQADGTERITVAQNGLLMSEPNFVTLRKEDGQTTTLQSHGITEQIDFQTFNLVYPRKSQALEVKTSIEQLPTIELLGDDDAKIAHQKQVELGKRLSLIWFVFNNTLVVSVLFLAKPRRSQLGRIFAVIGLHLLYRYANEWLFTQAINWQTLPLMWLQSANLLFLAMLLLYWHYRIRRW